MNGLTYQIIFNNLAAEVDACVGLHHVCMECLSYDGHSKWLFETQLLVSVSLCTWVNC